MDTIKFDESQLAFINSEAKDIRLLAPAGAGKTTCILERAKRLLEKNPKEKVLIISFTSIACNVIQKKIRNAEFSNTANKITITTLNSYGKKLLQSAYNISPDLLKDSISKNKAIYNSLQPEWRKYPFLQMFLSNKNLFYKCDKLCDALDIPKSLGFEHTIDENFIEYFYKRLKELPSTNSSAILDAEFFSPFLRLGTKHVDDFGEEECKKQIISFWKDAVSRLADMKYYTFEDQKYQLYLSLTERYKGRRYNAPAQTQHIIVDEFQDINTLDLNLISELVRVNNASLTIVGDDDQSIYEWRAAVPDFIIEPSKYFAKEFTSYTLENNYRSPVKISEFSLKLIKNNINRVSKNVISKGPIIGDVRVYSEPSHKDSIERTVELIKKYLSEGTVGVLTRGSMHLLSLQMKLVSENIPFYAKEDINLSDSEGFGKIIELIDIKSRLHNDIGFKHAINDFFKVLDLVKSFPLNKVDKESISVYLESHRPKSIHETLISFYNYNEKIKSLDSTVFYNPIKALFDSTTPGELVNIVSQDFKGLAKNISKAEDDFFLL